jgi:hypothetical protein
MKTMNENSPNSNDLGRSRAETPPGIDAPSPPRAHPGGPAGRDWRRLDEPDPGGLSAELLSEIRHLAGRVGGLGRLRELIDELERLK